MKKFLLLQNNRRLSFADATSLYKYDWHVVEIVRNNNTSTRRRTHEEIKTYSKNISITKSVCLQNNYTAQHEIELELNIFTKNIILLLLGTKQQHSTMRSPFVGRRKQTTNFEAIPYYEVAVLGDSGVGKSTIIERLMTGKFTEEHNPTAAEVYMKTIHNNGKRLASLRLFDTAAAFEFPVMLRLTISKCEAFFVVYSVDSGKSLETAKRQLEQISNIKGKHFPCVLVGNKNDISSKDREVSFERGVQTAVQHGCSYIEMSAKDDVNVNEAFCTMVKKIEYTEKVKERLINEEAMQYRKRKRTSSMKSFFRNSFYQNNSDSDSDSSH